MTTSQPIVACDDAQPSIGSIASTLPHSAGNSARPRATRKMFVAFVGCSAGDFIELELGATWCREVYYIALPVTDPAVSAYAGADGQLDSLFELQGQCAIFEFEHAITDLEVECTAIKKIKKVKGKT